MLASVLVPVTSCATSIGWAAAAFCFLISVLTAKANAAACTIDRMTATPERNVPARATPFFLFF